MDLFRLPVRSKVGPWVVEGDEHGVTRLYMPNQPARASRGVAPRPVATAAAQLAEYFAGTRRRFSVRRHEVAATPFQSDVWGALRDIPYGRVASYAEVARMVGRPHAARAVGNANHANPWPIFVPCHRVVAAAGLGGYGGGLDVKRWLLELEGVRVS